MTFDYEITWRVDDGFVLIGPHSTGVSLTDFDEHMSVSEIIKELEEIIREDFLQTVSWKSEDSLVEIAQNIYNEFTMKLIYKREG